MVRATDTGVNETLGLQPGELVEVRTIDEIAPRWTETVQRAALDDRNAKYCGKRYRVFKRVERIIAPKPMSCGE